MEIAKPVGQGAASRKYDIISALTAYALAGDRGTQRLVLRCLALITTRYNWQRDELSMGQEAIATLWDVDKRTVKRELAKLQARGWLVLKRRGARGRVSVYGLCLSRMLADTRPAWGNIGPDFIDRMEPPAPQAAPSNVVALRQVARPVQDGATWSAAQEILHGEDMASFGAWFAGLVAQEEGEGWLTLAAPTRFHATYVETHLMGRLMRAVRRVDPTIAGVRIEG
jgi:hypothetical protein